MQEDQQPNETWAQRRRDNRIPTVVSSASLGQFRHRRSRPSTSPWLKTKKRRGPTPGDHDTGFKVSSNNPSGKHRSMWRQKNTPHLRRGSASARDKSPTNPRLLVADNISEPPPLVDVSHPKPSPQVSEAHGSLHPEPASTDAQNNPQGSQQLRCGRLKEHKRVLEKSTPPASTGPLLDYSNPFGTPYHRGNYPTFKPSGVFVGVAPYTQSSIKPPKHGTPKPQPASTALLRCAHQGTALKQDPADIIDLTLDESDAEGLGASDQRPSSTGAFDNPRRASPNLTTSTHPTSNNPSARGLSTGSTILGHNLNLVKEPYDKPRVFISYTLDSEACLANVSAHGLVDQICVSPRWKREMIRSPEKPALESVHGACVLNAYGSAFLVLAHAREDAPVSLHRLGNRSPINPIGSYNRPLIPGKPSGLTAVCSMTQPLSFATGGADHAIHIWNVDHNLQATCSALPLAVKHTSQILSLLPIHDTSHKLVSSGADCSVNIYDLASERVVNMIKLSNPGFHIHHLENPWTLLIQTAHREHQFEIRDIRRGAANGTQTFGFPSDNIRLPRFARGDIAHSTFFACGDLEGRIHIWDLRNVREPLTQVKCFQTRINNVIWHESHILASSPDNNIAAIHYAYPG